jgi:single-strand DNA-binding protein
MRGSGQQEGDRGMSAPGTETTRPAGTKAKAGTDSDRQALGEGHISGNLTHDPELRYTPSGRAVCRLRVAYTPRYQDGESNAWKDGQTEFYNLDVWGLQGENCAEHLVRGDRVVACGNWQKRSYEDGDGNTREMTEMQVRDIGPSMLFRAVTIKRDRKAPGVA